MLINLKTVSTSILLTSFFVSLISCGGGGGTTPPPPAADTTPPIVVSTFPKSEEPEIVTNSYITVDFNEPISTVTTNQITIYPYLNNLLDPENQIVLNNNDYFFLLNNDKRLEIRLKVNDLVLNTKYQISIQKIKDKSGNPMESSCTWEFTTVGAVAINIGKTAVCGTLPKPITVPGIPVITSVIAGDSVITLNWQSSAIGGVVKYYKIDKSSDNLQTFTEVNYNIPATTLSINDEPVKNGTGYVYRIIAVNDIGSSEAALSNITMPVLLVVPGAPQFPSAIAGDATITVNWQAPVTGGAPSYYSIDKSVANAAFQPVTNTTDLTITDSPVVNDKTHVYRITAVNSAGSSGVATSVSVTPKRIIGFPGIPQKVIATPGSGIVDISWRAPFSGEPPSYYKIEKSINGATYIDVDTNLSPATLSFKDITAQNGAKHIYRVTAGTLAGLGTSALSNEVTPIKVYPFVEIGAKAISATNGFGDQIVFSSDGNMLVIGAPTDDPANAVDAGLVHIFTKSGSSWNNTQLLSAPTPTASRYFGSRVALSSDGKFLAVTQYNSGEVIIYTRLNGKWVFSETLVKPAATDPLHGDALAFSPDSKTLVIGSNTTYVNTLAFAGSIDIFTIETTGWVYSKSFYPQKAKLRGSFGSSITFSPDGLTMAIGAPTQDSPGDVTLYKKSGAIWVYETQLLAAVALNSNAFGLQYSVVFVNNTTIAIGESIGSPQGVLRAGQVHLFTKTGGIWLRRQVVINRLNGVIPQNKRFGSSVGINASKTLMAISDRNTVYLLTKSTGNWIITGDVPGVYTIKSVFSPVGNLMAVTWETKNFVKKVRIYNLAP